MNNDMPTPVKSAGAAAALVSRLLDAATGDNPQPAVVAALLQVLAGDPGEEVTRGILSGFAAKMDQSGIRDASWDFWAVQRHTGLFALLRATGEPASPQHSSAVLSRLALNQLAGLGDKVNHIEPLLAACDDGDSEIAARAQAVLRNLDNPASRSALCQWVIDQDHPHARAIALACNYTPLEAPARALFFLLTGQFSRYQELDFDGSLLEVVYAAGSETLRSQIAELARQTGLASFTRIMTGGRLRRITSSLTDFEWEAVVAILTRELRFADLWRLAQNAPPVWSVRMLHNLHAASWQNPLSDEKDSYLRLRQAADACRTDPSIDHKAAALTQHSASLFGHTRQITALTFLTKSNLLASASAEKAVRLWDLSTNRQHAILEGHTDYVLSLTASPDGSWLASGGADRSVRIWSLPEGRLVQVLGGHAGRVSHLIASPDGQLLFSGDERSIHTWHAGSGFRPLSVIKNQFNGLNAIALTPASSKSDLLVAGDNDRAVRIWSLPTPENPAAELRRTLLTPIVGWTLNPVENNNESLLASCSSYGTVQLWHIPEGEVLQNLPGRANNTMLTFSPDGRWLAVAASQSGRSGAFIWDIHQDPPAQPVFLPCGAGLTSALAFHPSARLLAVASQDRTLRLWQIPPSGEAQVPLKILEGHNTPVRHLLFTPDGESLFSADERGIHRWKIEILDRLLSTPAAQLQTERLESLVIEPDLTAEMRAWIAFSLELARFQRRFDIEIGEVEVLAVGDYDIELE